MADDHSQRQYRSSQPPARGQPARPQGLVPGSPPGSPSDPLAELARLIGQNDPFSEFGRDGARRPSPPPRLGQQPSEWTAPPAEPEYVPQRSTPDPRRAAAPRVDANGYYGSGPGFAAPPPPALDTRRQPYGNAPPPPDADHYQDEHDPRGYPNAQAGGYEHDPYHPSNQHLADEEEEFYDDAPPPRRRIGVMAIAGVFALAVVGTAGAFGYRAMFAPSGSSLPPPVIKADTAPSKILPATASAQPNKLINDRVNGGQGEKLVSREEQPVDVKDQTGPDSGQSGSVRPQGVVGGEPKKIRTITYGPDMSAMGEGSPAPAPAPTRAAPARQAAPVLAQATAPALAPPPQRVASAPSAADPEPAPPPAMRVPGPRVVAPVRQAAAPSANAPLSLNPDAPAPATPTTPAARAAPVQRTAAVAQPAQMAQAAATSGGAGSYVQISSQRSEADAQAAFRGAQGKFPAQLGSRQPVIRRVELGEKGTYFRAMVGPFASSNEAGELCSSLKAAGGDCIVQRN